MRAGGWPAKRSLVAGLWLLLAGLAHGADFALTDTQGRTHTLAGHQGKWVLLNLWATWCSPCLAEMPELDALSRARPGLVVIGVAADGGNPQRILQFAEKLKITYPVVAGNEQLTRQLGARGYPTSILYDPSGRQVLFKEGTLTRREVETRMDRAPPE
jgi:thiol-disulfide isomerase/thioredoxin